MTEQEQERRQRWGQLIARAWSDEGFKHRLLTEPATVLREAGLDLREGIHVKIMENTDSLGHLVLPAKPASGDMSEERLATAASRFEPARVLDCERCDAF